MTAYRLDLTQPDDDARRMFDAMTHPAAFRWPQVLANCTVYRARIGKRTAFRSEADALAYEAGYRDPSAEHAPGTPAAQGAADARADQVEQAAERAYWRQQEAAAERAADRWLV